MRDVRGYKFQRIWWLMTISCVSRLLTFIIKIIQAFITNIRRLHAYIVLRLLSKTEFSIDITYKHSLNFLH